MHENPLLIHLHIPKTAGVTLRRIADRQYPTDAIFTLESPHEGQLSELDDLSESRKQSIQLLRGHVRFDVHQHFNRTARYFTVLRDPVERIVSLYHYGRAGKSRWAYELIVENNMTLTDFASTDIPETNNHQTRLVSGDPEAGAGALECAKQNLENDFIVVGVAERFDETLLLLQKLLDWGNVHYYRRNVTRAKRNRAQIPPDVIRIIQNHNELDLRLHAFAEQKLCERLVEHGITEHDLVRFRRLNRVMEAGGACIDLAARMIPDSLKVMIKKVIPYRR